MKRRAIFYAIPVVLIVGICCLWWTGKTLREGSIYGFLRSGVVSPTDIRTVVQGNSVFALDFYQHVRESEGNLFFSPYSLSTALAMVYAGAKGSTQKQMAEVLHFSLDQERLHPVFGGLQATLDELQRTDHMTLNVANSIWPRQEYKLLDEYLRLVNECYGVSITPVDFSNPEQACERINRWVEEKTSRTIKDLIAPGAIDKDVRLVVANAIYFKANWQNQFDPGFTRGASFYVTPSSSVQAQMMIQTKKMRYAELPSLQVLELPYVGNHLFMLVLLPERIDGLGNLEASLSVQNFMAWRKGLKTTKVCVLLPRVTMTRQFDLADTLRAMGMRDAFDRLSADFAGMASSREDPLYVSAVIHKAYMEMNEQGTKAAAASAAVGYRASRSGRPPKPPPVFRADHPFVFLIQENRTGSILFMGRVTDPTKS